MWTLRSVGIIALAWVLMSLPAVDPCDPLASLDARQAFSCLAALREPLNRTPDDPRLLGLAITSYVVLSLPTPLVDAGDAGPFLDYARQLRQRREHLRGGALPGDLATALPELWLDAISGDTKAAMDGLGRFADVDAMPAARALRCFATRDWRELMKAKELTPLEGFALVWARMECGLGINAKDTRQSRSTWSQRIGLTLEMGINPDSEPSQSRLLANTIMGEVVWMLGAGTVSDAEAVGYFKELIKACDLTPESADDRAILSRQTLAMVRDAVGMPVLMTAWSICERLAGRSVGLMEGTTYRLVNLGDVARWNRDWLAPLIHRTFNEYGDQSASVTRAEREARVSMDAVARDSLPSAWCQLRWSEEFYDEFEPYHRNATLTDQIRLDVIDALRHEWDRPVPHSDGIIMSAVMSLAAHGPCPGLPELFTQLQQRRVVAGHPLPGFADRRRWCGAMTWCAVEADAVMRARLDDWLAHDPWDIRLRSSWARWSPDHQRLDPGTHAHDVWWDFQPGTSRVPRGISSGDGNEPSKKWFNVCSQGWIMLPVDGVYRFHVSSPDGVRLTIGPMVYDKWFYRWLFGATDRTLSWQFQAGWQPFRMESFSGYGFSECQLTWTFPGGTTPESIPPQCFANVEKRKTGLEKSLWPNHNTRMGFIPTAADMAWLHDRPWFINGFKNTGTALINHQRWDDALPWFQAIRVGEPDEEARISGALAYAMLFGSDPDPGSAFALLEKHQQLVPNWYAEIDSARNLGYRACQMGWTGRLGSILKDLRLNNQENTTVRLVSGICAMAEGDFTRAEAGRRWFIGKNDHGEFIWAWEKRQAALETLVLKRINGKPDGDLDDAITKLEEFGIDRCPWDKIAMDYLTGAIDWPTAQQRAAATSFPMQVRYYHALQALAEHHWDEASADLHAIAAADPEADLGIMATCLSHWLDQQTPAQLERRPKATAIPLRTSVEINPGNRF